MGSPRRPATVVRVLYFPRSAPILAREPSHRTIYDCALRSTYLRPGNPGKHLVFGLFIVGKTVRTTKSTRRTSRPTSRAARPTTWDAAVDQFLLFLAREYRSTHTS